MRQQTVANRRIGRVNHDHFVAHRLYLRLTRSGIMALLAGDLDVRQYLLQNGNGVRVIRNQECAAGHSCSNPTTSSCDQQVTAVTVRQTKAKAITHYFCHLETRSSRLYVLAGHLSELPQLVLEFSVGRRTRHVAKNMQLDD